MNNVKFGAEGWNNRFLGDGWAYGKEPNDWLAMRIKPGTGKALVPADGEGRNAVWIASQGYETKDKQIITKDYVEPKICENVKMKSGDVIIDNTVLKHIIEKYTDGEKGVRNLKRCIEIIYTKLNLYRLMKPESQLFKEEKSLDVTFPYTVTTEIVDKLIKTVEKGEETYLNFYL